MSNAAYIQIKVSIEPRVAEAFKLTCKGANVSMAGILTQYMAKFSGLDFNGKSPDLVTKRQRRMAVSKVILQLERIKASEEYCRNRIPENLHSSPAFESADLWVSGLEEVIDILASLD